MLKKKKEEKEVKKPKEIDSTEVYEEVDSTEKKGEKDSFLTGGLMAFTQSKAKKILRERRPALHSKRITKKQRGLLGLIAGGKRPTRLKG